MWELDHKEGWALKNWYFQIVVLEKIVESPLDSKIKPLDPKGNWPWIFIGRTDAEAEAPILWPPDVRSRLIGKDPDGGKDWGQKEKRVSEDEMAGWYHWCNGHELGQTLGDGEGQRGLVYYSPWGRKEWDTTERLNNKNISCRWLLFHGCWQKPRDSGSETKAFITHSTACSMSLLFACTGFPCLPCLTRRVQVDACTGHGLHYKRGTLSLGNLPFYSNSKQTLSLILVRDIIPQGFLLQTQSWEIIQVKSSQDLEISVYLARWRVVLETCGGMFPNMQSFLKSFMLGKASEFILFPSFSLSFSLSLCLSHIYSIHIVFQGGKGI